MTLGEERELYVRDRPAWLEWVAPKMAKRIDDIDDELLGHVWAGMPRDYQMATWKHMSERQQTRLRIIRSKEKAA